MKYNDTYEKLIEGGDRDLLTGDRDLDRDGLLRLLLSLLSLESLLFLCLLLGLLDLLLDRDLDLDRLLDLLLLLWGAAGGVGDLLRYLLFGGEGSFSGCKFIGLGLLDICLSPAAIRSSFSLLALFFAL